MAHSLLISGSLCPHGGSVSLDQLVGEDAPVRLLGGPHPALDGALPERPFSCKVAGVIFPLGRAPVRHQVRPRCDHRVVLEERGLVTNEDLVSLLPHVVGPPARLPSLGGITFFTTRSEERGHNVHSKVDCKVSHGNGVADGKAGSALGQDPLEVRIFAREPRGTPGPTADAVLKRQRSRELVLTNDNRRFVATE